MISRNFRRLIIGMSALWGPRISESASGRTAYGGMRTWRSAIRGGDHRRGEYLRCIWWILGVWLAWIVAFGSVRIRRSAVQEGKSGSFLRILCLFVAILSPRYLLMASFSPMCPRGGVRFSMRSHRPTIWTLRPTLETCAELAYF